MSINPVDPTSELPTTCGSILGTDEVLDRIVQRAAQLVQGKAALIERLDPTGEEIVASTVPEADDLPAKGDRGPYKGSLAERAIRTGKAILVRDVRAESRSILGRLKSRTPAVVLPLISDKTPIGVLVVLQGKKRISRRWLHRLETIAEISAVSLRQTMIIEELEDSLRARDEVRRLVAHDLRNPMHTILMAASSLRHASGLDQKGNRLLEIIQQSVWRMDHLIQVSVDAEEMGTLIKTA